MIQNLDDQRRSELSELLERNLSLSVVLAEKKIPLRSLLNYSEGSIIVLEDASADQLRLVVEGKEIGVGTAVRVGDKLAIKIDTILSPESFVAEVVAPSGSTTDVSRGVPGPDAAAVEPPADPPTRLPIRPPTRLPIRPRDPGTDAGTAGES